MPGFSGTNSVTVGAGGVVFVLARAFGTSTSGTGTAIKWRLNRNAGTEYGANQSGSMTMAHTFTGLTPGSTCTITIEYYLTASSGSPVYSIRPALSASQPTVTTECAGMIIMSP